MGQRRFAVVTARRNRVPVASRFAILCSWLGTAIAVALVGAALFLPVSLPGNREDVVTARLMLFVAPAIVALILGWGIRYLMTGPLR
jgi:hypothetical protein